MEKVRLTKERTHYFAPSIHIVITADIIGDTSLDHLKSAIEKAVGKHTLLTSMILQDKLGECFYIANDKYSVNIKVLNELNDQIMQKIINENERLPFELQSGELLRFIIAKEKEINKLIIIAHHLAGDGTALLYLLRDIMSFLSGEETVKPALPITSLSNKDIPEDAKLSYPIRFLSNSINKQWRKTKQIFDREDYINMFENFWSDRKSRIVFETIKEEELKKLMVACKKHGVTLNTVITTAFLCAARGENEVGLAVSVRPKGYEGMGNYASGISVGYTYRYDKSFWQNAVLVHKLIYKKLSKNRKKYFLLNFLDALEPTLVDAAYFNAFADFENLTAAKVSAMFGYNDNPKGISITNLTKAPISEKYGSFVLDNIRFIPPIVPNSKRIIGIVTLGNKMNISMQFLNGPEAWKEEKIFREAMKYLIL